MWFAHHIVHIAATHHSSGSPPQPYLLRHVLKGPFDYIDIDTNNVLKVNNMDFVIVYRAYGTIY